MSIDEAWLKMHEDAERITVEITAPFGELPKKGDLLPLTMTLGRTFTNPMLVVDVRETRMGTYEIVLVKEKSPDA